MAPTILAAVATQASAAVSDSAHNVAAYLRIASIAIALYDFIETMPSTFRFYKEQYDSPRLLISCVLLAALQITSIFALTISNVGFFYSQFTDESCRRFHLIPPTFKVLQAMASQAILGVRAFNLSRRSSHILKLLVLSYSIACALEWVTTLLERIPVHDPAHGNCRAAITPGGSLGAWIYYLIAIVYDLLTTLLSVFFLLKFQMKNSTNSIMSKLLRMMLYDGLGYFTILTAANAVNVILYRAHPDVQTAATSIAYAVTWIMSQRLLLHLHKASRGRRNETINTSMTVTRDVEHSRHIRHALRSQFDSKPGISLELTVPDFEMVSYDGGPEAPEVHVRIEKTVTFEASSSGIQELEDYTRKSQQRNFTGRAHR